MFSDSLIGTDTKSTYVAHISQMGLSVDGLTSIFWPEFYKFVRAEQAKVMTAAPVIAAGSKPGFVPVHPCPRIYTCAFGSPLEKYKAVQRLSDEITDMLYPTDDEPILERVLIRASANINNQVSCSSPKYEPTKAPELSCGIDTVCS
jgi:hypothetical protein